MSEIILPEFRLNSITPDMIDQIWLRLVLINTRPGRASTYLVVAFPQNAKDKSKGQIVITWPEIVLGFIAETGVVEGSQKWWDIHPTLKSGKGWRKKKVGTWVGRDKAATRLLIWWADQNEERLNPERGAL